MGNDAAVVRLTNPRDITAFLSGEGGTPRPWGIETEAVPEPAFVLETLMMGLRLVHGISTESFRRRFGRGMDGLVPGLWESWVEQGFASPEDGSLRVTDRGLLLLDMLLAELVRALRADRLPKITVHWPD